MSGETVLATIDRLFAGAPRWRYSLQPQYLARISTKTLAAMSDAIDAGWLTESYLRHENQVELRLTRLGERELRSYVQWRGRVGA